MPLAVDIFEVHGSGTVTFVQLRPKSVSCASRSFGNISDRHPREGGHGSADRGLRKNNIIQWESGNRDTYT